MFRIFTNRLHDIIFYNSGFFLLLIICVYREVFTAVFTLESVMKVLARGLVVDRFTYLRDAWNWLDFIVVALAFVPHSLHHEFLTPVPIDLHDEVGGYVISRRLDYLVN